MEIWQAVFPDIIPKENYQTQLSNGRFQGLILKLKGRFHCVVLKFGIVQTIRILDEGIVQNDLYSCSNLSNLKSEGFKDIIYEVIDGEFGKQIQNISCGYYDTLEERHYVIITNDYNIDVVTEWQPEITILPIQKNT
ncbi:hypothetical protein DWX14_12835 [Clostridiaceae bacterium AF18-31LB]|nr:hypothetical protein DWX14_12835 [Clostridiaceae bacterium AF18-31LB]